MDNFASQNSRLYFIYNFSLNILIQLYNLYKQKPINNINFYPYLWLQNQNSCLLYIMRMKLIRPLGEGVEKACYAFEPEHALELRECVGWEVSIGT